MREFDTDDIRIMAAFENITHVGVRDCIRSSIIYFLVDQGKAAIAIGRDGQTIKIAERMLGKNIKVFEFCEDCREFIKNMIPQERKIEINGQNAVVHINDKERGIVIGKSGSNIKIIREFLERNSNIKELKII